MVCGSIGCRFKSFFSPILHTILKKINYFFLFTSFYFFNNFFIFNKNFNFLNNFFKKIKLIWEDALLIDFLQKKIVDNWTKKFLIISSYLVNEKFFFEKIIKFFLNLIIWPWNKFFPFEFTSVASLLLIIFLFFFIFFYIVLVIYFFNWMF